MKWRRQRESIWQRRMWNSWELLVPSIRIGGSSMWSASAWFKLLDKDTASDIDQKPRHKNLSSFYRNSKCKVKGLVHVVEDLAGYVNSSAEFGGQDLPKKKRICGTWHHPTARRLRANDMTSVDYLIFQALAIIVMFWAPRASCQLSGGKNFVISLYLRGQWCIKSVEGELVRRVGHWFGMGIVKSKTRNVPWKLYKALK